ncbi:hypothetical protein BC940DRAFT_48223 [Gongronella butleri]|nr:hypothetical protein BC940DRAFT_48223 [Gongronella butleri]
MNDCAATFANLAERRRHELVVHGIEALFPCRHDDCLWAFEQEEDRGRHERTHEDGWHYPFCNHVARTHRARSAHVRQEHPEVVAKKNRWQCPQCNHAPIEGLGHLINHLMVVHWHGHIQCRVENCRVEVHSMTAYDGHMAREHAVEFVNIRGRRQRQVDQAPLPSPDVDLRRRRHRGRSARALRQQAQQQGAQQ